jgi:CNT family concentrative nucleoside transporter
MTIYNLISFGGLFVLIGFAFLLSSNKKNINFRVIVWGVLIQLIFGLFIFLVPAGTKIFLYLNDIVVQIMNSSAAGAQFLFGRLALPPGTQSEYGEPSLGFYLAFQALPTIIFFSALMSILYYYGIMQKVIKGFSYLFTRLMRISGAESLGAASNIFVGVESVLTIRPFLNQMTRSELCTVLTAGMATVSSNILALYIFILNSEFPTIASHLISASILSAPAAIVMSKILLPESGNPVTLGLQVNPSYEKENSIFESIINGANGGVRLIVGIAALLVAVLGLVALLNLFLSFIGAPMNSLFGTGFTLSLQNIFGYIFYPFTVILGVPLADAFNVSKLIGEKVILTEVVSYQHLSVAIKDQVITNPRSIVVTTYALCGFTHLASMAIFVGGFSALVPDRKKEIASVGFRALVAATLACLMTACVSGIFFTGSSILLQK